MEFERKKYNSSYINIAPLLDVVFLLLLFFMLTSQSMHESAVKIRLPDSKTATEETKSIKTVSITKDGTIYFMGKRIDLTELHDEMNNLKDLNESVRIKADREANVGVMIKVVDTIRLSGIINFSIVTDKIIK